MTKVKQDKLWTVKGKVETVVEFEVLAPDADAAIAKINRMEWNGCRELEMINWEATGKPELDL